MENEAWRDRFGSVYGGPVHGRGRLGDDQQRQGDMPDNRGGKGRRGGRESGELSLRKGSGTSR